MKIALLLFATIAAAQPANTIQSSGSATINVQPDQAQVTIGVVTQGSTAQAAAQANAGQATAMIDALKAVLGTAGTIQTVAYSISPRYSNSTSSQPPVIVGYTASNTVQVITNNLNLVGPLIDAGNTAGANSVGGPVFGLQNPDPVRQQALTAASKQALAHAGAIAAGLGLKTGAVISAQEVSTTIPVVVTGDFASAAAGTPIQNGTVSVTANVTVTVAMVQ